MADKEQVRPLAPAAVRPSSDFEEAGPAAAAQQVKQIRRRKRIKCWVSIAALFLIPAIAIVILIFTVFRIKDPVIRLNGVTMTQLQLFNGTALPSPGRNISLLADVSVKNPNVESFKYDNTTTGIYYHGDVVGEARGPPGRARAGRTVRMNITVDIVTDRLLARPELFSDLGSGLLTMTSYSKVAGRVHVLRVVKRHVTVKMNCTITLNVTSRAIHEQKCKRKVDL